MCLLAIDFNRWGRLFNIVPPEYRRLALKDYSSVAEMIACDYADIY